jgi:hypothetical protein
MTGQMEMLLARDELQVHGELLLLFLASEN